MITVPEGFGHALPPEAATWLAGLPALAAKFCARWQLSPDGPPLHGAVGLVLPVRRADGHPAALKLTWVDEETRGEPLALRAWDGDGAVRLLDHDDAHGALLLERLDHTWSLLDVPIEQALLVAGGLTRRLRTPAGPEFRRWRVPDLVAQNAAAGGPVPARLVAMAVEVGRELVADAGGTLVNEDLHYANVLRGEREPWLAIDPKPLAGDREVGLIALLRNRVAELDGERGLRERFAALVDIAELDVERARRWVFHRAVASWPWCVEKGYADTAEVLAAMARLFSGRVA
ncbi:aminoglycoside phosphotransferase family protein [Saccharothrix coeruleofusca]|uniref:Aminoglycoside O-phosphotransferase n=1 Tax=Saccharothrix coeruleofusca TaxID=33919 RepID=A0A918EFG0_9PSEU|nr:aminoglycoside phosphotransferase family protein [Saccharothrix coeruleofusca]GGP60864.1 aminoglycoside O-phosphotransferase [Saccharothrix coeruleofusca]